MKLFALGAIVTVGLMFLAANQIFDTRTWNIGQ